jgi:hypothetical protein
MPATPEQIADYLVVHADKLKASTLRRQTK